MPRLVIRDYVPLLVISAIFLAAVLAIDICIDQSEAAVRFIFCGFALFWIFPIFVRSQRIRLFRLAGATALGAVGLVLDRLGAAALLDTRCSCTANRRRLGAEYGTMITGIRFMALAALALYAGSLIALLQAQRRAAVTA